MRSAKERRLYIVMTSPIEWAQATNRSCIGLYRVVSRFVPSHCEAALHCNDVSHWLDASLEPALYKNASTCLWLLVVFVMLYFEISFSDLPQNTNCWHVKSNYFGKCHKLHLSDITRIQFRNLKLRCNNKPSIFLHKKEWRNQKVLPNFAPYM